MDSTPWVKHWNRMPRKVVRSLFLEVFEKHMDMALEDIVWGWAWQCCINHWTLWSQRSFPILVVLRFFSSSESRKRGEGGNKQEFVCWLTSEYLNTSRRCPWVTFTQSIFGEGQIICHRFYRAPHHCQEVLRRLKSLFPPFHNEWLQLQLSNETGSGLWTPWGLDGVWCLWLPLPWAEGDSGRVQSQARELSGYSLGRF